jgi:hypothetical protein
VKTLCLPEPGPNAPEFLNKLIQSEETGMGFHVVDGNLTFTDDRRSGGLDGRFLILNCEFILPFEEQEGLLTVANLSKIEEVEQLFERTSPVTQLDIAVTLSRSALLTAWAGVASAPTAPYVPPPFKGKTRSGEVFFRFSAFARDRKVAAYGDFLPNTYATTLSDFPMAPSGAAAVGRYALPTRLPARYVFAIVPSPAPVLFGTVAPGFGQAGGGVEVLFPHGATQHSGQPFSIVES